MQKHRTLTLQASEQRAYGLDNLPPDDEAIDERMDELDAKIERIERQLAAKGPERFSSAQEYSAWKSRASNALKHARHEHEFLSSILDGTFPLEIFKRVHTEAERVRGHYGTGYSASNEPPSEESALDRFELLKQMQADYESFRHSIADANVAQGWGKDTLKKVTKPLGDVLSLVAREVTYLTKYLQSRDYIVRPTDVLLEIIVRSLNANAAPQLALEEEQLITHLCKQRKIDPPIKR